MSRVFLVTGSASGIGKASAERLLAAGHRVIGADIRDADIIADLGSPDGRTALISAVRELAPDGIDGVLASAGITGKDNPRATAAINYFGTTDVIEGLYDQLRKPGARCVVVSSAGLLQSNAETALLEQLCLQGNEAAAQDEAERIGGLNVYPGTKHALTVWARKLAVSPEWALRGALLNVIAPAQILTPMTEAALKDPELVEILRKNAPRATEAFGTADEVAELVDFLLNCRTGYIVGQVIFIDGGTEAILRAGL